MACGCGKKKSNKIKINANRQAKCPKCSKAMIRSHVYNQSTRKNILTWVCTNSRCRLRKGANVS